MEYLPQRLKAPQRPVQKTSELLCPMGAVSVVVRTSHDIVRRCSGFGNIKIYRGTRH
jgi:hypothetical protein